MPFFDAVDGRDTILHFLMCTSSDPYCHFDDTNSCKFIFHNQHFLKGLLILIPFLCLFDRLLFSADEDCIQL